MLLLSYAALGLGLFLACIPMIFVLKLIRAGRPPSESLVRDTKPVWPFTNSKDIKAIEEASRGTKSRAF